MTTSLKELQQRAATEIEVAYEAGYDDAVDKAYEAGYEDGRERGYREAIDIIETTRNAFDDEDPGDTCSCPICQEEAFEDNTVLLVLTGDYEADMETLVAGLSLMGEKLNAISETVIAWDLNLADELDELDERVELLEADAVLLESVNLRLAALEAFAESFGFELPAATFEAVT